MVKPELSDTKNGLYACVCVCVYSAQCERVVVVGGRCWCLCDLCGIILNFPLHPDFHAQGSWTLCISDLFKWQNVARLTHQKLSPPIFQSGFKMKLFPSHRLKNNLTSTLKMPPACLLLFLCLSVLCFVGWCVWLFFMEILIISISWMGFEPRQSCKCIGRCLSHSVLIICMTVT